MQKNAISHVCATFRCQLHQTMAWQVLVFPDLRTKKQRKAEPDMNAVKGIKAGNTAPKKRFDRTIVRRTLKCLAGAGFVAVPLILVPLTFQSALAQSQPTASAQPVAFGDRYYDDDAFMRRIYGGIGIGRSFLEPDTSQVDGVDPNRRVNNAGQIMIGADLNKWLSVEGHAATLGDAGLSPSGSISYQEYGISALAYIGKNRHHFNRRGLIAFGRLGYGLLENEPSPGLAWEQVNPGHVLMGAGLEFATRMGLGVRAEAIAFDTDVRLGQLSLLYRFGKRRERRRELVVEAPQIEPTPAPVPVIIPAPVPAVAVAPADFDVDGVHDSGDRCPNTQPGVAVDDFGCDLFNGVIEGVNFNSGSADLTQNAQSILNGVVMTLDRFPSVRLTIMAHTDSQGADNANKDLSKRRARSVAVYLVRNGVSASRLKAYGYGEARPIDSNDTVEGRLRNRRVEFSAAR